MVFGWEAFCRPMDYGKACYDLKRLVLGTVLGPAIAASPVCDLVDVVLLVQRSGLRVELC